MGNKFIQSVQELVELLKDPYIVARFQNYFGVYLTPNSELKRKPINACRYENISNGFVDRASKISMGNGFHRNGTTKTSRVKKGSCSPTTSEGEDVRSDSDPETSRTPPALITNRFWYYFFSFGASLGYELFYASFFPFWNWNIDGAVFRRVIWVWVVCMYIGQAMKDIIRWQRPSQPPVVQLEPSYSQEYGMPSTHAMVGAAVPFSILIFTMHRYQYPFIVGLLISIAWCTLVCCSRLYMGMHTVLDILGGLSLVCVLMAIIIPLADHIDHFQLTSSYSPLVIPTILITLAIAYPASDRWSPARGDTTIILGTGAGISMGSWLNYQLGFLRGPGLPPPYMIMWPDYGVMGLALLRASIGILCLVATRAFFRSITYAFVCYFLRLDPNDMGNRQRAVVEVPYKFISYTAMGIVITYLAPIVFRVLNIERITMFTEV